MKAAETLVTKQFPAFAEMDRAQRIRFLLKELARRMPMDGNRNRR